LRIASLRLGGGDRLPESHPPQGAKLPLRWYTM
jgi:hypothetical protein